MQAWLSFEPSPPLPGGVFIADGVRVAAIAPQHESAEVTWCQYHVYRNEVDIGGVDYWACRVCRCAFLGKISFVDWEQRRGLGTRVLTQLRAELPGYCWCTTAQDSSSAPFWRRIQQHYPGEYCVAGQGPVAPCSHIQTALRPQ